MAFFIYPEGASYHELRVNMDERAGLFHLARSMRTSYLDSHPCQTIC